MPHAASLALALPLASLGDSHIQFATPPQPTRLSLPTVESVPSHGSKRAISPSPSKNSNSDAHGVPSVYKTHSSASEPTIEYSYGNPLVSDGNPSVEEEMVHLLGPFGDTEHLRTVARGLSNFVGCLER